MARLPKIIAIVGPTSSGKTSLSFALAKQFDGEIINADARQFYQGFTIGTGKPIGVWKDGTYLVDGIPHHLMDQLPATGSLSVAEWKEQAYKIAHEIIKRGHVPILVGGTGLYVQAFIDNLEPPAVGPQPKLRQEIAGASLEENQARLKVVDPTAYAQIDIQNPRRLQRALEVALTTGHSFTAQQNKQAPIFDVFQIGLRFERAELNERIDRAVDTMLDQGWLDETRSLVDQGIPVDAPSFSSIGYRQLLDVIEGHSTLVEATARIKELTHQYAKRQMTWFKRDSRIHWLDDPAEAAALVKRESRIVNPGGPV